MVTHLDVPGEVTGAERAQEVLRAWVADGGLVCALQPDAWGEYGGVGIVAGGFGAACGECDAGVEGRGAGGDAGGDSGDV